MAFDNLLKRRGRTSGGRRGPLPSFEHSNILGVDYKNGVFAMQPNLVPYGLNAYFGDPIGSITKAPGFAALFSSLGTGGIKGLNAWPHSTGAQMVMAWGKNLYALSGGAGTISKTTQADWETWTRTNLDTTTSPGTVQLPKGSNFSSVVTNTADFNGTQNNTQAASNAVSLTQTGTTSWALDITQTSGNTARSLYDYYRVGERFLAVANQNGKTNFRVSIMSGGKVGSGADVQVYIYTDSGGNPGSSLGGATISAANWPALGQWVDVDITTSSALSAGSYYWIYVYCTATSSNYPLIVYFNTNGYSDGYYGEENRSTETWANQISYDLAFKLYSSYNPYATSGTYTHGELNISGVKWVGANTISYNATTPSGTTVTLQTRYSIDDGTNWSSWATTSSGATLFAAGTDLSNYRLQWRASLTTTSDLTTPSLNDVTISMTAVYMAEGSGISPIYDLGFIPATNILTFTQTAPAGTTITWYARGSSNGTTYGDWQTIDVSGAAIPLHRYIQLSFICTSTGASTPSINDLLISYTTAFTTANKIDIGPLGRTGNELTGNRVSMVNYEDWCLCADGLRPWLIYITTATQMTGSAQGGAAGYITLPSSASAVNDYYNNSFITITSGTGAGQVRWITDYTGSTKQAVPSVNFNPAPDSTSVVSIGSAIKVRKLGVDPPTVAPSVAVAGGSGLGSGNYYWKYTFVNADGSESNPSPASSVLNPGGQAVNVTVPVDASAGNTTVKRKLYRTAVNGSVYKYVATINDNTTTSYNDSTADVALSILMYDNNNIPGNFSFLYQFGGYVFGVDKYDMWFSKAGNPDPWPNITGDIQVIIFPGVIADIKNHPMALIITGSIFQASITSNSGFIFDSDPTVDTTTMKVVDNNGGLSWAASAMCLSPGLRSTLVMNTNTGLRAIVPGLQDNSVESIPLSFQIQPYYERSINRDQSAGIFFNGLYLYSMEHKPADGSATERLTFALNWNLEQPRWNGPWQYGMSCYTQSGNILYAGDAENGIVYQMFSGNTFAGENIHMKVDLPVRAPLGEGGTCQFHSMLPIVSAGSDTSNTLLKPKVDDREATVPLGRLSSNFTGDQRPGHDFIRPPRKYPIPLPYGSTCSVRIEDDSGNFVQVEKVLVEYEPLSINR